MALGYLRKPALTKVHVHTCKTTSSRGSSSSSRQGGGSGSPGAMNWMMPHSSSSLQETLIAQPTTLQCFSNDSMSSLQAVASSASSLCYICCCCRATTSWRSSTPDTVHLRQRHHRWIKASCNKSREGASACRSSQRAVRHGSGNASSSHWPSGTGTSQVLAPAFHKCSRCHASTELNMANVGMSCKRYQLLTAI